MSPAAIWMKNNPAIADTSCAVHVFSRLDGVEVHLTGYTRLLWRAERYESALSVQQQRSMQRRKRKMEIRMTDAEVLDRIRPEDVMLRERAARDGGRWNEMAACYHPESMVEVSWYRGSGAGFVEKTEAMARGPVKTFHVMGQSVVTIRGDRALMLRVVDPFHDAFIEWMAAAGQDPVPRQPCTRLVNTFRGSVSAFALPAQTTVPALLRIQACCRTRAALLRP